jgi:hypothetical protein
MTLAILTGLLALVAWSYIRRERRRNAERRAQLVARLNIEERAR